jgi:hypothetical protein
MSRGLGAMGRRIEPKRPVSDRRRRHARALFVAAACLLLLTGILAFIMVGMTRLDTTGCDLHPCIPPTLPAAAPGSSRSPLVRRSQGSSLQPEWSSRTQAVARVVVALKARRGARLFRGDAERAGATRS